MMLFVMLMGIHSSTFAQPPITLFSNLGKVQTNDPQLLTLAQPNKENYKQFYYAHINIAPLFDKQQPIPYQKLPDIIFNIDPNLTLIGKVSEQFFQTNNIDASGGNWQRTWRGGLQNKNGIFVIVQQPHGVISGGAEFEGRSFSMNCHKNVCLVLEINLQNPQMKDLHDHG
jgi:hypothetical protein